MSKRHTVTDRTRNETALAKYHGKKCRVFLKNGMCLTGIVSYVGGEWLGLAGEHRECTVNTANIDCIGEI